MNDREFEVWRAAYMSAFRLFCKGEISHRDIVVAYADNAVRDYQSSNRTFTRRPSA